VSPNKHYSEKHEATEKKQTKGHLKKRFGKRYVDSRFQVGPTTGGRWRRQAAAQNRSGWRGMVCGLCSTRSNKI